MMKTVLRRTPTKEVSAGRSVTLLRIPLKVPVSSMLMQIWIHRDHDAGGPLSPKTINQTANNRTTLETSGKGDALNRAVLTADAIWKVRHRIGETAVQDVASIEGAVGEMIDMPPGACPANLQIE